MILSAMTKQSLRLDDFLPYRLSFTTNLVSETVASAYEQAFGLRIAEWRVIAVVAESPRGVTQQAIGLKTRMDKVTVSRAAASLIARALLERRPHDADQRSHLLTLSAEGEALYSAIVPKALALERQIFSRFSAAEIARFDAMLRQIDAILLEGAAAAAPS